MKLSIVVILALSLFACAVALPLAGTDDLQTATHDEAVWGSHWRWWRTPAPTEPEEEEEEEKEVQTLTPVRVHTRGPVAPVTFPPRPQAVSFPPPPAHASAAHHEEEKEKEEEKEEEEEYCAHRCKRKRERKNWNFLTPSERSLYIEAVQELYNAGVYTKFVKVHQDGVNDPYAHGTSGFLPWHRKFLMEYENALRCLAPKFACVTVPYWNWGEWQFYCNEQAKADGIGCTSYQHIPANMKEDNPNAQSLLAAFGGEGSRCADKKSTGFRLRGKPASCSDLEAYCSDGKHGAKITEACPRTCDACEPAGKTYGGTGHHAGVGCVTTGPFAGWKDWEGNCLTRGVDWSLEDEANGPLSDRAALLRLTTTDDEYGRTNGYRAAIQGTPHNMAHNYLGGHMRSMRSPMDPIFFSHHAYVDKNWAVWQDCKDHEDLIASKLSTVHYEALHRETHKGIPLEDDGMDSPMPFKILGTPFVPGEGCAEDAPGGAENPCRDCLGMLQKRNNWCDKRWHPQCAMLCSDHNCMAKCGTGGTSEDLVTSDFARADGKKFEYVFDHDQLGDTPRHWAVAPGRFKHSSFSYQIEDLDRDLAKESCKMTHGGHEEAQLSAADLLELEAQDSKSSLYSTIDLQPSGGLGTTPSNAIDPTVTRLLQRARMNLAANSPSLTNIQAQNSASGWKGWFPFRGNAEKIKKAHPAYSPKKIAEKVEQDWVDDQCRARDASKMCKLSGGGVKDGCKWSCSGPVDKQPELCGFNAAFNYLMKDSAATVSDDCVAYSSKATSIVTGSISSSTLIQKAEELGEGWSFVSDQ